MHKESEGNLGTFCEKYTALCEKYGKKPATVLGEIGISKSAWTKWKNGSVPEGDTIRKLASYFNVPTDYFFSEEIEMPPPADEDGDTARIREAMRRRPGIKLLFDALEDAPDSDLYETLALVSRLKEQSKNK